MFVECDRLCCVCRGEAKQIHHLNEDPSDHRESNLAALCFDCHNDTQVSGGFGRRLSQGEIRRHRDEWIERVRGRKQMGLPRLGSQHVNEFGTMLDAIAIVRVRELRLGLSRGDDLDVLYAFADGFGPTVTLEVMHVLSRLALDAKRSSVRAARLCEFVSEFLPIRSLAIPTDAPRTAIDRETIAEAQDLAFSIAYHAARRSRDLKVLNAGARVLWSILRFAVLNDDPPMRDSALGAFVSLNGWCDDSRFTDGQRWLTFLVEDATQLDTFVGHYPADIETKLLDDER